VFEADFVRIFLDPLLDFQSRQHCALRIVLMGDRRAKESQDGVTH
jgi:hypothetical protein